MKIIISFLIAIIISRGISIAQVKSYYINADSTFPGMEKIHSGHFITVNMSNRSGKKLLVSIPGTTGPADVMRSFDSVAALEGYHTISIDYPNNRNTATFINSIDKEAFNKFRQELDFGTPVSDSVNVDSLNSIVNRITKLVIYLAKTRPAEGWNNFLDHDKIIWERVTLAGHSQGAGHVSYIGHAFKVHKVIMLSGPQDFLSNYDMPAPWLSADSKTPYSSFYSFLHDDDAYNTQRQIRNDLTAMHADSSVICRFQNMNAFSKQCRIFISGIQVPNTTQQNMGMQNHMASIMPMHSKVWIWLLKD
ncbi:hypothetical protein FRZ67_05560 [Panacibacter ginsenosidivorans]|uniref:Alpha/beta hydrolase n=1 Tax=Panacibacter ginsenosidivorans TaxID=1813871 RepID=A0A5B8V5W9_9BACT|nr:hypothetical protein [Panacibacter ginsenosidivorans]QEC66794.1 hypothetical protein FRZ67_05560 [Panacibacter ginsenosidivorans]